MNGGLRVSPGPPFVRDTIAGMNFARYKRRKIREWERRMLTKYLAQFEGNVTQLARFFEMDRRNLSRLLRTHGLRSTYRPLPPL